MEAKSGSAVHWPIARMRAAGSRDDPGTGADAEWEPEGAKGFYGKSDVARRETFCAIVAAHVEVNRLSSGLTGVARGRGELRG